MPKLLELKSTGLHSTDGSGVFNETSSLKKLIIHRPDEGIELITPDKALEYLYEDIVFLKKMQQEHDMFTKVIQYFIGKNNILDIQDLLEEVLEIEKVKDDIIDAVCMFENRTDLSIYFKKQKNTYLASIFITGYDKKLKKLYFPPAANLIFCRDIGVFIGNHILVSEASKHARSRESLLCRFIFKYHIAFSNNPVIEISSFNTFLDNAKKNSKAMSIEGGDVMMVHKDHLLVGHSERTTLKAIEELAKILFSKSIVKSITIVSLPKERYCMHLDTIFTMLDKQQCIAFEPLVCKEGKMKVVQFIYDLNYRKEYRTLKELMLTIYPELDVIPCGGGIWPHAEREQWTDGCNIFALADGVGITYDRNIYTAKALEEKGYTLINAKKLISEFQLGKMNPKDLKKTIILIPSNELSRARGGTHCLTLPMERYYY